MVVGLSGAGRRRLRSLGLRLRLHHRHQPGDLRVPRMAFSVLGRTRRVHELRILAGQTRKRQRHPSRSNAGS